MTAAKGTTAGRGSRGVVVVSVGRTAGVTIAEVAGVLVVDVTVGRAGAELVIAEVAQISGVDGSGTQDSR